MAKEGGIRDGKNELTISLNETLPYVLQFTYTVGPDPHTTAATSDDYKMSGDTVKIPAGNKSVTIDVGIVDDDRVEPTEYFTLRFSRIGKDDRGNSFGTFNNIAFRDSEDSEGSKLNSQRLSVSIMDNDTAPGGVVYLRGEGGGGIEGFPSTRKTLTEGQSTTITAEIAGAAPTSPIQIPLKFDYFPSGEATSNDHNSPGPITIMAGEKTGSVTLTITDDTEDERYRELLVVEIDEMGANFPGGYTKGDRSKYEVIMLDNDKTEATLQMPSTTALTEAKGARTATFEFHIDRRPKAAATGNPPFEGADTNEGDAKFVLAYAGTATRGADYRLEPQRTDIVIPSTGSLPSGCTASGEMVTCEVTLTVQDDMLYEGGTGTTERVKIDLNAGGSTFNDGIKRASDYKSVNLTIEDNDLQPMFSIADVSGPENGNLTFAVTRTGARGNDVSVTASTGDHAGATNGATARTDYNVTNGSLRFESRQTSKTFRVAITDDNIDEPDETFAVTLSNPVDNDGLPKPAIKSDGKTAVGTITDNDDAPTQLTISVDTNEDKEEVGDTIAEAAGQITVTVTATIDSPTRFATDQTVTVTVGNPNNEGEASKGADGDYEAVESFDITIPATEVDGEGTFELTPVNDNIDDDDEKISVEGAVTGMTVTHAAITIEDDDTRGITVKPVTLTLDEADDMTTDPQRENTTTYGVKVTSQPEEGTVTVNVEVEDSTVATVGNSSLEFNSGNWETTQLVTVTAQDDTIDNTGDQRTTTITHTVSAEGTDYHGEQAGEVTVTVTDNDEAPTALTLTVDTDTDASGNQDKISEGADTPAVRITATLDGETQFATDQTITITVGADGDTATEGTGEDYGTVDEFEITLPARAKSVPYDLTLTLNDDSLDEPEETVTVAGELAGVMVTDTMFTIVDNDATPTVTLVLTPASINESGATNASTVTATMDGQSSEAVTLTVSATPVSPAIAGDLTLSDNKTLTIPAKSQASTGVVTIAAVDNDVDAANKTVTVSATATGGNALVQAPGNQTLTITDDDTRGITVSKATLTLDEADNTATMDADEHQDTYTVVLDSEPSGGTVTIGVASGGTNVATVAPNTLTFTASNWDEPQTVTVTAVPDIIDNPNDRRAVAITHTVNATGTDYDDTAASGVTVTVNDDDGAPTLSINSPSVTEVDNGATATLTFTVRLTPASGKIVTVDYADAGTGTATTSMGVSGPDYDTLAGGTLTFAPGETSKSVAVTVSGDDIDEPDETVVVRLSSPSEATLTGGATTLDGTGTINDNDATPTVSVADATAVSEGNVAAPNPANNMTFAVTLSAVSGLPVTVPYTLSGTATAGTDYTEPDPRSVMIEAGGMGATIAIPVAGDEVDEENETITVTLGTPTNATVSTAEGAGAASGTITDDDTRGVSITPTTLTVAEADNASTAAAREDQATYEVVLTSQPTGAVTVNLKSGDESVARINTASLVFDADDWNTERTVTVTGQPDVIDNTGNARATTISHTVSAAGTDYATETAENVAVTVTDDDAAPSGITLTANPDSVTENGGAKTITVTAAVNGATRYADARTVSVSVGGGTAISGTDYTAVESFDITIGAGEDDASNTFTLTPENDVLAEGNETIGVTGSLSGITITPDEITLTDDDAVPSGITLSVDTNGAEDGTPSAVGEDAGATVVTVTATVNGDTRYVEAKTVAVSVADGTAASPADYAAVSNFNITIAAGVASHTGSFTVTPVDDDLDEANETIDVTGTLSSVTIAPATVTITDNDDPVSFSIADAEATEGGKVEFTVSRAGAGDNVASVKVTTATDSGDGANAADADDYTAIATAQTVNFAKGVASQTVEVQTTQDDLFEPDETFKAVLSAPALGDGDPGTAVSIESGKGTATGTIKNDDTQPSFAVADASAAEGDAITFTVTRSGAMDNAVSVKWNTKPATGVGAASTTDYTPVTAATVLNFARGASSQTFTVATTEDVLAEGDETFLVELTGAVGGTIATAEATGTITDDDAAPTGITLSVDADTATNNVQSSIAEEGGVKTVRVTATINGATRFATAQTVTVTVGKDGDSATEGTDYSTVDQQSIEIPIGAASAYVEFMLTPTTDVLFEESETISLEGTLTGVTFTNTAITITDDDAAPSGITLSADADTATNNVQSSIAEEGGVKTVRVTATIDGTTRFATAQTVTVTVGKDGDSATEGTDYSDVAEQSIEIPIGAASAYVEFMLTPTTDVLFEESETISLEGTLTGVTFTNSSITITDDDAAPSAITLSVDTNAGGDGTPTTLGEGATATTVRVTATITSATRFATEQTVKVKVGKEGDSAAEGTDYALVADQNIKIPAGAASAHVDFSLTPTQDVLDEANETISVDGELTGVTFAPATITINDDDAAPEFITLTVDTNAGGNGTPTSVGEEAGATTVRVTATITSATRFEANQAVTFEVGKSADSAAEGTDYTEVGTLTITIDGGDASGYVDFTLTPTSDALDEPNETISVHGTQADITFTDATITITDDDAAPSGITLSVDTNGSTAGTPSTVAEDAGATVVTVTATVNGSTRYVDAKTVAVSVDDDTAASPADYAAVSGFNITIAAGAASQTGSFTVTPVDDDLDEANETIDVTGTLTGITITSATVTLTDNDDPVSFSIADAEATEGGKITFTVSRGGAEDNVASVKIATAADSGDGVNAAGTSDYTAIATAQTLNFAKGVTSQTVEVQTTQDDLFEPDETFRAVLSDPALGDGDPGTGVTIESGKGTAIGTIKNDDTQPSFAVADASASEGDAITFTVTRSGAMDNAVSVKWNTKSDSSGGANAAFPSDYTRVTTARTLTFAKGVSSQTFTVDTTEDVLDEDDETFLVELTGAVGATIATAQATGTITDDDAAPSGITLSVSPATVGEGAGETEITVTATVNGATRYVDAKTVTVSVGGGSATSDTDYDAVANFDITIAAGAASHTGTFDLTPTDDDLHEGSETIDVTGVSGTLTITKASITLEDDDVQPSFAVADASASEGDAITFTVTRSGAMDNAVSVKWNTKADSSDGANAASAADYTPVTTAMTLSFAKGVGMQTFTVATTEDTLNEANETFLVELTEPVGATITDAEATGTITNDDAAPTTLTLAVDADNNTQNVQSSLAENGGAKTVKVTATLGGSTQFDEDKTLTLIVGDDDDSATEGTDYTTVSDITLTIPAGDQDIEHTFTLTPTDDAFREANETISFDATISGVTVSGASITLTSDDAAPSITLTVDADKDTDNVQTSLAEDGGVKTVRVTATLDGTTRLEAAADLTLAVGKSSDSAVEGTDYANVADRTITIGAGVASVIDDFTLTPTNDDLYEGSETISLDGTLTGVTVTDTSLTLTDDDAQPSFAVADASAAEGDAITFTVTRSGAMDNVVSVKWNTKADSSDGANAASASDYTPVTTATKLDFAKGVGTQTFTVTTTEDVLAEGNETFLVELTEPVGAIIGDAQATGTITDDDAAPSGITLSVDTNGSTAGTPSTVAEDAGATVVTVTATVNGTTRYVDARTVAVSVADGTAASPADYAAVSGFNITIAAGAASHTGSFTVTPVDDDLDEANETIDVTGTLSSVTIAPATVTITDNDAPVSFSIADAEATEGGKVEFTVSRAGAEDNVASVKIATAADSGDGVNAAGTDDYTAIATAQTLNFAKDVTSQTVEVQTTQDDLFEPDETFRAVLSAPALGDGDPGTGVTIESGKGTAIGTIKNDDTQPSFAVADASAAEGDAITFTVTRSGAMDNAVSVKWNTRADSGAGAASTSDYTAVPTARTLTFAKSVSSQTFTVATTEDNLHEGNETFLVVLTAAEGGTISTAEATGTINDDDAAPTALTLSVDADTGTDGTQINIAENGGAKTVRVTATLGGNSTFTEAKTVTLEVGADADSATEVTDYAEVTTRSITINAGSSSGYVDFTLTPTDDTLHEGSETISLDGTLTGLAVTDASITLTDDDGAPTALTLSVDADTGTNNVQTSLAENGGAKTVRVTATLGSSSTFTEAKTVTLEVGADTDSATEETDYTEVTTRSITINAGMSSGYVEFTLTPIDDTRHETSETISLDGTLDGVTVTDASLLLTDNDAAPTTLTLAVDADNNTENVQSSLAENGGAKTVKVTATLGGATQFDVDKTLTLIVGDDDDSATEGTDYTAVSDITLTIPAGDQDIEHTFTLTPTDDAFREANETISFDATISGVTVSGASITLTSDDAAPSITLTVDADKDTDNVQTSLAEDGGGKTVRVTVALDGTTRLEAAADLTLAVGKDGDSAVEGTDYATVANRTITIGAGVASVIHDFTLTPTNDDIDEPDEGISIEGTLTGITVAGTSLTITDDEVTPTVTLVLTPTAIDESGDDNASTVTAMLSGKSSVAVTLAVAAAAGADTVASDFTVTTNKTLTIAAGATTSTGAVTITAVDNDVDAPNKSVTVSATASGGGVANPGNQTLTINDDEGVPTATLVLTPTAIDESGATNSSTVTAMLSGKSSVAVTLAVAAAAGADTVASDFTVTTNKTLTIAAGATTSTGAVTITAVDNDVDAPNKSVTVSATASGGGVANPGNQTLTINDDEGVPTATLVLTPTAIDESGATNSSTVTAMLSGKSNEAVTLTVAAAAGANTVAADFSLSTTTTLTIAAGATTSTGAVTITAVDNNVDAPNKSVTVSATASGGGVANPGNQTLTINDDDAAPSGITLSVSPAAVGEEDGETEITVTATVNGSTRYVDAKTVTVSVGGGTAISGTDYDAVTNFDITIAAGDASKDGTFDLTPTDDVLDEANETINVTGTSGSLTITPTTITITDDDDAPGAIALSVDADTSTNGTQTTIAENGGAKTVRVTATITDETRFVEAKTVSVEVGVDADSATEGADYANVGTQSITINAGAASGYVEFTLTPTNDTRHEASETISLDGTLTGLTVTDSSLSITDNDAAPTTLTLAVDADNNTQNVQSSLAENGGAKTVKVTATLGGATQFDVDKTLTLIVGADDDSATEGTDYTAVSDITLTIPAGDQDIEHTFTLTPTDDAFREANETISFDATISGVTVSGASITLTSDDAAPAITLTVDADKDTDNVQTSLAEDGGVKTVRVTATLGGTTRLEQAADLTLAVGKDGDSAVEGTDYATVADRTITIGAGVASVTDDFTLTPTNDVLHEGNETISLDGTLTGVTVTDATITLTDDDAAPTGITLSVSPAAVGEGAGETEITVTATVNGSTRYVDAKTVTVSVGGGTAISGTDYDAVTNFDITIAAGDASKDGTFDLTPTDDDLDEANETINVTGTSGSLTITPTMVTITDDDAAPGAITISVDADTSTNGTQTTIAENGGAKTVRVTATITGDTRFVDAKTVTLEVGADADSAEEGVDYANVGTQSITINAGAASGYVEFTLTPTQDVLHEGNETISLDGTLTGVAVTDSSLTLTDDDAAPTGITLSVSPAAVGEEDGETEITVTATVNGTTRYVDAKTVTVSVGGGTAISGTDYDAVTNFDITIAAGDASKDGTFDLTPTDDVLDEANETINVTGTSGSLTITSATVTITDDDAAPTGITLTVSPATVGEGDGETEITVTATVNGSTRYVDAKTVTVSVGGGTATSDTDYDAVANFDIVIAAGDASKAGTFDLTPTQDDLHEGSETINLAGTVTGVTVTDASLTLTDDDGQPSFAVADASASEGDAITFTVTRSGAMDNAVSVKWNTKAATGAGAAATTDYTAMTTATKLDFASGASSQTFTVATTEDTLHEGNETFLVELTEPVGAIISDAEATGTITDDDAAPTALTLSVDADTGTENVQTSLAEDGGAKTVRVTATLGGSSTFNVAKTVSVEIGADADGATEGTDYANLGTESITIDAGSSSGYVDFTITPTDDDIDEPNEGISIEGTLAGVTVTGTSLTITDDEGTPTVTLVLTPSTINESGNGNASTVTATLSGESSGAVTVEVSVPDAAPVTMSNNTTLTIVAGSKASTGAVTITAVDNDVDAPNASVSVSGAASGGGVANPDNQTLTITDDEGTPTVTLVLTPTAIDESGDDNASTVTAMLSGKSNTAVTLTVAAAAGANTVAADFTVSGNKTLTIAAGATTSTGAVTITAVDNDIDAPNKTVTVSAAASGGGVASPGNQTLTITDDEGIPTVTLALDPTTINESGNGNASTVTAMLSGKSSAAVTVTVSVPNDAPVTLSSNAILSIAAGATTSTGTVTITAVDNDVDAANASVLVSGVAAGGSVANPADQTLTITDDEGTPTVTLVLTPTTIDESGATNSSTVTAMLSGESSAAVTLTVAAAAGANTAAADFTVTTNKTLTIAAGSTTSTGTVTITAVDNDVDAPNKSVTVSATASGGGVANPDNQTLTINDDEGVPTVTLALDPGTINESGGTNSSTVTATLSGESSAAVTVEVSVPDAAPVTMSNNTTLTIAAGSKASTGAVTITAVDNDVDAPNASVAVSGAASGGGVANPDNQTLTITDDEGTPTVTLVLTPTTIDESGATNSSTVTAMLSGKSNTAVTLTVAAAAGADTVAGDFTLSGNKTLTIAAGATTSTGSVKITAVDNNVDGPNKSVTVSATASGGGVANPDNQTLTITDDDAAPTGIALSVSPATLGEGDGLTTITVTATVNGSTRFVEAKTVTVSVGSGTAISGTDFGAVPNFDITIAAGDASKAGTFDLTPTDDTVNEEDETIEVTGTSGALTITPATVTITDNDASGPEGTVSLSASRYEVLEGDSLSVTVSLSEPAAADAVIELEATSPGGYSATSGTDYEGGVQTVTIRAGTTSAKARIWTIRDNQNDPNETFELAIRASELPGTVTLGEPDTAVVTIRERVTGITPPETATVKYAGRRSRIMMPVPAGLQGHGIDVAFYFDWGPGTAQGGGDCREPGTDVVDWGHWPSFPEGMVRTGPLVRIAEDIDTDMLELEIELCEGSVGKTFTATWDTVQWLGNPDRGFPGFKSYPFNAAADHCTSTALCWTRVTIVGDAPDPDPEVTISAGSDITEGGDAVFTVQATPAPKSDLEVTLAIADDAASDFLADGDEGSKTVTIAAGSDAATYTLATTDDELEEADGGVSATLEAGTGYQVGSPSAATVAVADNDDDARATVVRITGGADITEGSDASFTLTGAPAPSQDITVNLRVTQSGAFAGDGELGARTVTLGADATVTVDIPTVDDSTLEDDGSLTVTVEPGTGYTPHATDASATVAVADDEVPSLPTIHIDDVEAPEGEELHFTFTLSHAVDHEVVVYWETRFGSNAHDDENGHGPSYGEAVSRADFRYADSKVTVYPGGTRGEFWVQTYEDSHDEGREHFTVVLTEAEGAIIADELAIGTIVNSDPMPAAWLGRFGRAVAEQAIEGISERIEAAGRPGGHAEPGFRGTIAGITLGGQRGADEDSGSGESDGPGAEAPPVERPDGASGAFGFGFGFGAGAMPSQPGAFGYSTLGPQSAGSALGTGAPAAPGGGPGGFGEGPVQRGAYGYGAEQQLAQMLLGSHFTYTGKADEAGGVLGYWGRGAQTRFDGAEGNLNLDGDVTTAMLGVDYARNNWLVGMALTQSLGSGGYRGSGTGARPYPGADLQGGAAMDPAAGAASGASLMDGAIETSLTAAIPYASWRASERLSLWGAAGYGVGEMTLEPGAGESLHAGIGWSMAAAGLRSDLFSFAGGTKLDLISDALWARTGSERIKGLVATESAVTRLRLGIEASREFSLPGGGSIAPKLEVGARHDGGSAEAGLGVEVGGGIAWTDPRLGIKLDLLGRTLISHEDDDMGDKGFSASLAFDRRPDSEQGLALTLRQDIGATASGGLEALFANDPLARRTQGSDSGRLTAELGYGWPLFGDRFIGVPHLGYSLTGNGREIGFGWRLAPDKELGAADITLKVLATRAESLQGEPADHRIGIEIQARW